MDGYGSYGSFLSMKEVDLWGFGAFSVHYILPQV